jgi:FkbM family methyltransferase
MKKNFRFYIDKFLKKINIKILKYSNYSKFITIQQNSNDLKFIKFIKKKENILNIIEHLPSSTSQLRQDLFCLNELNFKKNGFFVEFGANDGVSLSNTYLLEKEFNWNGILVEPNKIYLDKLRKNRKCHIDTRLIYTTSDTMLLFAGTREPEFSKIKKFYDTDFHASDVTEEYYVNTISLNDLLIKFNAPKIIDYISIDTEGCEYDIIKNFNFDIYKFRIITCEHNFSKNREKIHALLTSKGYVRKLSEISQFDDWYVNSNIY